MNVCNQTFHVGHVRTSQNVKGILCNVRSSAYHFYVKKKIVADFRICVSVSLNVVKRSVDI